MEDLVELIDVVAALEKRFRAQKLRQDATYRPNVDCNSRQHILAAARMFVPTGFRVALEAKHNLRCSVPSGRNIFGHIPCVLIWVHAEASRQPEVTNLEFAVGIHE